MQRYKKSAKSKTEQVKNLCPSVKSVGKKEKQQRKNQRHLRNLRDKNSDEKSRWKKSVYICEICGTYSNPRGICIDRTGRLCVNL